MRTGISGTDSLHRLMRDEVPPSSCSAEMGKLMVTEGLGITVLPSFSVVGDPLERSGSLTWPLADDTT